MDPLAEWIDTGKRPLYLRQIFGTILFSTIFTLLSYLLIAKGAATILADDGTRPSESLIFLGYFSAAYAAMSALLDFKMLAVAVTKKIDEPKR